jgi:hypothetical protein
MTTTHVAAAESSAARPRPRAVRRDPFFVVLSAVILLLVVSGFTPTLYLRPLFKPAPMPGYLFLHGTVLTSWFVWFCLQTLLIQSRRTALHRRLGVVGAVLAAAVPFAGLLATSGLPGRVAASGIALDADASAFGIGVSGTVIRFISDVVWGNLGAAVSFALLAWTGILMRRRIAVHKRLMLLATITVLGPALARLARLPFFGGEQGPFTLVVLLALTAAVLVHDVVTLRTIHPATAFGVALGVGLNIVCTMIAVTDTGQGLVRWLQ